MSNFWGAYQLTKVFTRTYEDEYEVLTLILVLSQKSPLGRHSYELKQMLKLWCRFLSELRATASEFRCIMSAVGTTPLQSPGCNEGKARNETLGIHERKVISSSVGAAL